MSQTKNFQFKPCRNSILSNFEYISEAFALEKGIIFTIHFVLLAA